MNHYQSFEPLKENVETSRFSLFRKILPKFGTSGKPSAVPESVPENRELKTQITKDKTDSLPKSFQSANRNQIYVENISFTKLVRTVKSNISHTIRRNSENLDLTHKLNRVYWMPDSICHKCYGCDEEFTTIKRKHHCRMCGQIFCYRCCTFELPGILWNLSKPQRSCRACFQSYYSNGKVRNSNSNSMINQTCGNSSNYPPNQTDNDKSSISIVPENSIDSSNRALSFSSHDIAYISQKRNSMLSFVDVSNFETESFDDRPNADENSGMKRTNSLPKLNEIREDQTPKKLERKLSNYKLAAKYFLPQHILLHMRHAASTQNIEEDSANAPLDEKIHKKALLIVWRNIIDEIDRRRQSFYNQIKVHQQTRLLQERCPSIADDNDEINLSKNLSVMFREKKQSLVEGRSLLDWITNIEIVKNRMHAKLICQSYLEMQLILAYFPENNQYYFKDDSTLYTIREFTAECSPRYANKEVENFFPDTDIDSISVSSAQHKSVGNSVFYGKKDESEDEFSSMNNGAASPKPFDNLHNNKELESHCELDECENFGILLWNRSCEYVEKLLKQELRDYNLDISWCNILMPNCKKIAEVIVPRSANIDSINDIRKFVQIKKIPDSKCRDCKIIHSFSISKNLYQLPKKEIKNCKIILIRASISYWKHSKLVSIEPLILQEEEYLRNCIRKITNIRPDVVIVEGSVTLVARDMMEKCGLIVISNVRQEQLNRMSRMFNIPIYDSVDSITVGTEVKLGLCNLFSVQNFSMINGRQKTLVFLKYCNPNDGCTVLLSSSSLSELFRVKYIIRFIIFTLKNAYLEVSCLKNLQFQLSPQKGLCSDSTPTSHSVHNDSPCTFLDIIKNRNVFMSANVQYKPPASVLRSIDNPDLQKQLLSLEAMDLSFKDRLNDIMRRKQRHVFSEIYDTVRMRTLKHPLMYEPPLHPFLNCFHEKELTDQQRSIFYSDFRINGSRFMEPIDSLDNSISTVNFESSDSAIRVGFLTKAQEIKWRSDEKKMFNKIHDLFNPRNFQRLILLYSIQTPHGICDKPRRITLTYYDTIEDRSLGSFVSQMLNDVIQCPSQCEFPLSDHIYKFVHGNGCIQISIHHIESESHKKLTKCVVDTDKSEEASLKVWNWCSRCDKTPGLLPMTPDTWNYSLAKFFDLFFNIKETDSGFIPAQCSHSIQTDVHYYFTQDLSNKVLEMRYFPVTVYEFKTPGIVFERHVKIGSKEDALLLKSEVRMVTKIKNKTDLDIKSKLLELKKLGRLENFEKRDFLQQDCNTEQYSETVQNLYNLVDTIYSSETDQFDQAMFEKHEWYITEEITRLWITVVNNVTQWNIRLNEAFENEEKMDKRLSKNDLKSIKSSPDDFLNECDITLGKNLLKPDSLQRSESFSKRVFTLGSQDQLETDSNIQSNAESEYDDNLILTGIEMESKSCTPVSVVDIGNLADNTDFLDVLDPDVSLPKREITISATKDLDIKIEKSINNKQPLRRFFSTLFNSNGLKTLQDPVPPSDSYVFQDIVGEKMSVIVKDGSLTSVIAFALSSNVYADCINQLQTATSSKDDFSPKTSSNKCNRLKLDVLTFEEVAASTEKLHSKPTAPNIESMTARDHEVSVRYINHQDPEDGSDSDCPDKSETEDIKIELSIDENLSEDVSQTILNSSKLINPNVKKAPKNDIEINLINQKVKCVCKIYFAKEFHNLRMKILGNDELFYIRSLADSNPWKAPAGKSGAKFRRTADERFIIKQLSQTEFNGFRKFNEKYFEYMNERLVKNEKCALAKIFGIYHVDYNNTLTKVTEKADVLVMENIFYNRKPSRVFDLKGKKPAPTNLGVEKTAVSDNSVLQDKDFISYTKTRPLYSSYQAQFTLKQTLIRDTEFLQMLPVMDYSLLVGVDDKNKILIIGIIDYLRMFTMDKLIEMHFKQKLMTHGEQPTVIQPQKYQKRFIEAMNEYFLVSPTVWDCILSGPPLNSPPLRRYGISSSGIPKTHLKSKSKDHKCIKQTDENRMRLGFLDSL